MTINPNRLPKDVPGWTGPHVDQLSSTAPRLKKQHARIKKGGFLPAAFHSFYKTGAQARRAAPTATDTGKDRGVNGGRKRKAINM